MNNIDEILKQYELNEKANSIVVCNQGNINCTYIVTLNDGEKLIIQKINTTVFKNPYIVMNNIEQVTKYISNKRIMKKPLEIVSTNDNRALVCITNEHGEKEFFRCYKFIQNSASYDNLKDTENPSQMAYNAGIAFGQFHYSLDDFPIESISETIPDFHNTPKRIDMLLQSIKMDVMKRAKEFAPEIIDLFTKSKNVSYIYNNLGKKIPFRVTHNDTKLNNILFDKDTNEVISVIDLDTLMPGSVLFDIGDGIRSSCANSFEDETNPDKISLNMELTKAYLSGYLDMMMDTLTKEEIDNIALSIKTLTYELAVRFLTDYINGDVYFKTKYPHHNADRFMNQYLLMKDIEKKEAEIQEFVNQKTRGRIK